MALSESISLLIQADLKGQGFAQLGTAIANAKRQVGELDVTLAGLNNNDFAPVGAAMVAFGGKIDAVTLQARALRVELDAIATRAAGLNLGGIGGAGGGGRTFAPSGGMATARVAAQQAGIDYGTLQSLDPALAPIVQRLMAREAAVAQGTADLGVPAPVMRRALTTLEAEQAARGQLGTAGRAFAGLAGEQLGAGGRLGYGLAALGPGALAAGGVGVAGFLLSKASIDYQTALSQSVAQYYGGTPQQAQGQMAQLGGDIMDFTGSGRSFYSPTTIAKSIEPALAMFNEPAVIQALPALSTLSRQNNQKDLSAAVTWLTTYGQNTGLGPNATGAQLTAGLDLISQAETMTSVAPGKITTALPTLFAGIRGTPISIQEAMGQFLTVAANRPGQPKVDVNQLVKLYQDIETHNTVGAMKEAQSIELPMGPGAIEVYGGIAPYLAAAQQKILAAAGGDPIKAKQIASQIFPQTGTQGGALQAYMALTAQGALGQSAGFADRLFQAGGQTGRVQQELQLGVGQQASELMSRAGTDMIKAGDALNQRVVPALLGFASGSLTAMEGAAKHLTTTMGDIEDWLKGHRPDVSHGPIAGPVDVAGQIGNALQNPQAQAQLYAGGISGLQTPAFSPGLQARAVGAIVNLLGGIPAVPGAIGNLFSGAGGAIHALVGSIAGGLTGDTGPIYSRAAPPAAVDPMVIQRVSLLRGTAGIAPSGAPIPGEAGSLGAGQGGPMGGRIWNPGLPGFVIADRARDFYAQAHGPSNAPVRDIRGTINAMLATGVNQVTGAPLSAGDWDTALRMLQGDLAGSKYTAGQRAGIYAQEAGKVGRYEVAGPLAAFAAGRGAYLSGQESLADFTAQAQGAATIYATAPGLSPAARQRGLSAVAQQTAQATTVNTAQIQLQAATLFQDSVRIHHGSAQQMVDAANKTYNAAIALDRAQAAAGLLKGTDLQNLTLQAQDKRQQDLAASFQRGITPLQDAITNAQLTHNPAALAAAMKALDAYYTSQGGKIGGLSKTEVANAVLQNDQLLGALRTPSPQLIRPNTAGLGGLGEAGVGQTVAMLVGGPAGTASRMLALAEQQIRHLQEANNELRQEVAYLRSSDASLKSIDRKTSAAPAHTNTHPRRGPSRPHGARR